MMPRLPFSILFVALTVAALPAASFAQDQVDPQFEKIDFANGLFQRGLYDMAANEYREFIRKHPESAHTHEALFGLAESYFFNKNYERAAQHYKEYTVQFINRDKIQLARLRLAQCQVNQNQFDAALEAVDAISEDGLDEEWLQKKYYVLAQVHDAKGDADAAVKQYQKAAAVDPSSTTALEATIKLGEIYKSRNEYAAAVDAFQRATVNASDNAIKGIALYKQAETAFLSGDYEISADLFAEVVDLNPDAALVEDAISNLLLALFNVPAYNAVIKRAEHYQDKLTPGGRLFDVRYVTARSLKQLGQYDAALTTIDQALGLEGLSGEQKNKAVDVKVEILFLSRKYADVIELIDTAWADAEAYAEKGIFFKAESEYSLANFETAHGLYGRLLETYPETEYKSEALYGLAHAKNALGKEAEAAALFEEYFASADDEGKKKEALFNQILLKSKVQDYQKAIADSLEFLKAYPDDKNVGRVRFLLGSMYSETKQYDQAIATFEHIVQRDLENPKRLESMFLLAYNLQLAERLDDALAFYRQVPRGEDAALYYSALKNMALIHLERQEFNKAIMLLKEIVETYDENDLKIDMYLWIAEKSLEAKSYKTVLTVLDKAESKLTTEEDRQALAYFRGAAYQEQGQCQSALAEYEEVVNIETERLFVPKAYLGMARCLMTINHIDAAKAVLDTVLLSYADEAEISLKARFEMGGLLEKKEQLEEAAKFYMLVAVLYNDPWYSPESLFRAGRIFEQLDKLNDARNVYQEIIQLYTKSHRFNEAQKRLAALNS